MSDLISRSELIKAFNNKNVQITFDLPVEEVLGENVDLDDFAMLVQDAIQVYKKMVIDTIKNQPTVYDVDKVVEELNNISFLSETRHCENGFPIDNVVLLDKAIEIVKQGGASEDICKWELKNACYTTSIKHYYSLPTSIVKTFNNCPYCGNKIKIVGD